ncbi:MAG: hypothetical protein ABSF52_22715 [Syntrophobacteraceae bacterium]
MSKRGHTYTLDKVRANRQGISNLCLSKLEFLRWSSGCEKCRFDPASLYYNDLKKKFTDAYLIRNERDFKIFNFDDGRPLEPDFLLYLMGKEKKDTMYYQVFIEPKGGHLLLQDAWKEQMLTNLKDKAVIEQLWKDRKYVVWGMPFFNSDQRMPEFEAAFKSLVE